MSEAASKALALLAVDPIGLGGAVLRGPASPSRDAWLAALRAALILPLATGEGDHAEHGGWGGRHSILGQNPGSLSSKARPLAAPSTASGGPPPSLHGGGSVPFRRMPPQVSEGRLVGGLDLAATLAAGRPVAERGLLAEADGGVLVVPMAERLGATAAGLVAAALDCGEVVVERDGLATRSPARFAAILLDEGEADERAPAALAERVAFAVGLEGLRPQDIEGPDAGAIAAARQKLSDIIAGDDIVEALAGAGLAFGVPSLRVATFALRAARASAALGGRTRVADQDAELAAALVIAPRATRLPAAEQDAAEEAEPPPPEPPPDAAPQADDTPAQAPSEQTPLADSVVEATRAAIPPDLLALIRLATGVRRPAAAGRAGAPKQSARRGRPAGTRRGQPGHGVRLAVIDTLRAAAPWQRLRREASPNAAPDRLQIRRDDFRVARFKQRSETVTIFVVDASGSAALHRLAEVKGAIELILGECYVRRDGVALIAFRGASAELILPPTRSLARAKRALAGQPGGGGTPLAAAIEAGALLADAVRRKGQTPLVVLLTDGKANMSRAGQPGRPQAEADTQAAAEAFHLGGSASLLLDIAPRPGEPALRLSAAMGARYIPLPYADAQAMSRVVLATSAAQRNV